ncbi:hypothetical protein BKA62DRAFT_810528 [Auriculariales sp. MPI-PUGE-AT-0066]|nr:hypothetical protein BKA62DRAFT_810528 [Auriculariales sp. MPI-PUGE-AT-0066]
MAAMREIVIVGGMRYINHSDKWFSNPASRDGVSQHSNAENMLEFWPPRPTAGTNGIMPSPFLIKAGGLNTYAHTFLMPSGKGGCRANKDSQLFMNANYSSVLVDTNTFQETALPDDPNQIVRVYPASAGVAMLPLTPENNTRRMTRCWARALWVILPDGTYLMINGVRMGTAGYTTDTPTVKTGRSPKCHSTCRSPRTPSAIYNPSKPKGSRWSSDGLKTSAIPHLYHSTAILIPDGRVLVAGSNPGADVSLKADNILYPTTYDAEYFYPPYWGKKRLEPSGVPKTLTYGGAYFQLTLAAGAYTDPNTAAAKTKVVLICPGFTTHALTMGQCYLQLTSTYQVRVSVFILRRADIDARVKVAEVGKITLTVSQLPPNANLFTPGPYIIFVIVDSVPSVGTHLIVGSVFLSFCFVPSMLTCLYRQAESPKDQCSTVLHVSVQSTKFGATDLSDTSNADKTGAAGHRACLWSGLAVGTFAAAAALFVL